MRTYQVGRHKIKFSEKVTFPNECEMKILFAPGQPFGAESGGGLTLFKDCGETATVRADFLTGKMSVENEMNQLPLDGCFRGDNFTLTVEGQILRLVTPVQSEEHFRSCIEYVQNYLPVLLSLEFADPVWIKEIEGVVAEVPFHVNVEVDPVNILVTTRDQQRDRIEKSWKRTAMIAPDSTQRVYAALHYFYMACRLSRSSVVVGEFLSEVILNLSKVLEVLFPASGEIQTRDAARNGLLNLGYSRDDVEAIFIPAMALRSEIDVAHVDLSDFTPEELGIIRNYTKNIEAHFRGLLRTLVEKVESSAYEVPEYSKKPLSRKVRNILEKLKDNEEGYRSVNPLGG